MDLLTVLIAFGMAWIVILALVVALCTVASRADTSTDRLARLL
jgi:hypothetical protein